MSGILHLSFMLVIIRDEKRNENKDNLDVWNELKYDDINKNSGYKVQTSIEMNNKIYVGSITNNKLYTTVYDNGNWSTISNGTNIVIGDVSPSTMEFKIINNKLYLIFF